MNVHLVCHPVNVLTISGCKHKNTCLYGHPGVKIIFKDVWGPMFEAEKDCTVLCLYWVETGVKFSRDCLTGNTSCCVRCLGYVNRLYKYSYF